MSSHFTYEIDERKLKVRLKDLEVTAPEEAWRNFETYSLAQQNPVVANPLSKIEISLNRSVVIPVVFGVLIVLFSFLLFNFINIKKPTGSDSQNQPQQQVIIPPTEIKPGVIPESKPVNVPVKNNENNAVKVSQPAIKKEEDKPLTPPEEGKAALAATTTTNATPLPGQAANKSAPASVSTVSASPDVTVAVKPEAPAKKKKNKRAEIVDNDSTPEARPAVGSEERETAERPN